MGFFDGLIKTVAGPLVSGGLSLLGGVVQNNSAKNVASDNNAISIELANTAHQREVKDLKAAGLNPILSAHGSGASSPGMQGYQPSNAVETGVSSATRAAQLQKSLDNLDADTAQKIEAANLSKEQQVVAREQAQNIMADYWLKDAQKHFTYAQTSSALSNARIAKLDADAQENMGTIFKQLSMGGSTAKTLADTLKVLHGFTQSGKSRPFVFIR